MSRWRMRRGSGTCGGESATHENIPRQAHALSHCPPYSPPRGAPESPCSLGGATIAGLIDRFRGDPSSSGKASPTTLLAPFGRTPPRRGAVFLAPPGLPGAPSAAVTRRRLPPSDGVCPPPRRG